MQGVGHFWREVPEICAGRLETAPGFNVADTYSYALSMSDIQPPDAIALSQVSYGQDGYFTTQQARAAGFSPQLLAHHVRSGRYEHIRRGLYRLSGYPGSPHEDVRAKWLAVGAERAVVSHESALDLHELSDVIPNSVHLLVDRDDRGIRRPQGVTLHTTTKPLEPSEVVSREGIRATDPVRSILDAAAAGTAPEQIEMAVRQALHEGLTTRRSLLPRADRRGGRVADLIRRAAEKDG
jgi:predicted transcriptional regulator of viral defense system